ncbi:MAG: ABC transporter ATP-binding protein [Planctomycetota bacterium]
MNINILIEGVSKRFGNKLAVDNLSLSIREGECYAFLGPNGAGKTTTIKMMTGLLQPTSGSLRICGHDILKNGHQVRSNICYIPDSPYLYDRLSGREFLNFTGRLYGMSTSEIAARTEELSEVFATKSFIDEPAGSYSHGMKQRVVVMAGLMHDPKVIILDEPMVGLDPWLIRRFKDVLAERRRHGATVFMSTHNLADAEEMADRIGIIHVGRLVLEGTLEEIRAAQGESRLEPIFLKMTSEGGF